MNIGYRLRCIREEKHLSQTDVQQRTGLLRCYISRLENGHTVPSLETVEKIAKSYEMPLYKIMYDGHEPPPSLPKSRNGTAFLWGSAGKDARFVNKLRQCLAQMNQRDRSLLLGFAEAVSSISKRSHGLFRSKGRRSERTGHEGAR